MEILICLAILWLLWMVSSKRYKRLLVQPLVISVVVFIILTSPAFINLLTLGLTVAVPDDSGDRTDTIVVLGRGSDLRTDRLAETWQLWQDGRASNIFASGMMDAKPMVRYLRENGVPVSLIAGEECSQTTEENGLFTSAILRPQGVKDILLVTDEPHMWRSLLIFRSVGFNVVPHPTTLNSQETSNTHQLIGVMREYGGMLYYSLTGKFQRRSPEDLDTPSSDVTRKLTEWNCKLPRLKSFRY